MKNLASPAATAHPLPVRLPPSNENRVLILAPFGNDAPLTRRFLNDAGVEGLVCRDSAQLCRFVEQGCGAIVIAEEALRAPQGDQLAVALSRQPSWSDIPVIVIVNARGRDVARIELHSVFGVNNNVNILERPFHPGTLVSTVTVALRGRHRQYQTRTLLLEMMASEERFRTLASHAPVGIFQAYSNGNTVFVNQTWSEMAGMPREEALGRGWLKAVHPADRRMVERGWNTAVRQKVFSAAEFRFLHPAGKTIWVEGRAMPLRDGKNKFVGYIGTVADITQRREADQERQRLASIVESSHDAIISEDLKGIITSWNRGAEEVFGHKAMEVIGQSITVLMPHRETEEAKILARIRRGEHIDHYETTRRRKDGRVIEISLTVSPLRDASGKIIGASKIARDVTRQKENERELERVHKEVLASSRAKDDFLAALSHELRTPLNPVLLIASEAARDRELSPRVRTDFDMIRKNVELEARLIDDLLDLTRISRGKMMLEKDALDLHEVLKETIHSVMPEAKQKRLTVTTRLKAEASLVLGDTVRLQQVFWNLLKNAIKFTSESGHISVETMNPAGQRICVRISDDGIGLEPEEMKHIFEIFSQGAHRKGGLGLGLTICRSLVTQHGGTICADSAGRGKGATFFVDLPLLSVDKARPSRSAGANPSAVVPAPPSGAKRILLVEDHEPTRLALVQLLLRRRHHVASAGSLEEARQILREGSREFDLLISDIGLPDGNGCDLMRELRALRGLKGIALTGYGMEQDINSSHAAGFSTHLTKPVRVDLLDQALASI